jgi:hypothetical protein
MPEGGAWQSFFIPANEIKLIQGGLLRARAQYIAAGAPAQALECARIFVRMDDRLKALSQRIAVYADREIVKILNSKQIRPDTDKGTRLQDLVKSRAVASSPSVGAVQVALLDELNKARRSSGKPYWMAQEFGYDWSHPTHQRGIIGFFQPGNVLPGAGGLHPAFTPNRKGRRMQPVRDIEPKRFLSGGTDRAAAEWIKGIAIINADAVRSIRRLMGTTPKAPRVRTRGRRP